jgi:2,5-dioxopentanoate dehydrogenase
VEGLHQSATLGVGQFCTNPGVIVLQRSAAVFPCTNTRTPVWFETEASTFVRDASLSEEIFGPSALVVWCSGEREMLEVAEHLEGSLTATVHATPRDEFVTRLVPRLETKAGRVIWNGYPTGLEVSHAIVHGGPFPSTSDGGRSTSVGTRALTRWGRLVCYQNFPDPLLPPILQNANPLGIRRLVNGAWSSGPVPAAAS